MIQKHFSYYIKHLHHDIPAGLVVFLVALPLCLGVALASGAPLFSGLIAGMVGGLVVAWMSGSQLSVSGPAAGLTVIVLNAIDHLGSFQGFLVAVVLAGVLQLVLGFLRAGAIGAYFPSAVIEGMLAAIGLILIMKQIPHAVGYDFNFEGDESYMRETALATVQALGGALKAISPGATVVSVVSLLILMLWESSFIKRVTLFRLIPGALLVVAWGIVYNLVTLRMAPEWAISSKHLVSLPVTEKPADFLQLFTFPDFSFLAKPEVYTVAFTIAIIASLETLLSLEAADKMDPLKRVAPTNRELKAQGVGNMLSGLIGGIPITAVIVRSAANINAGGQTKVSSFVHGSFLLLSVMFLARFLNNIPLSCLAAILLQTGYKLAKPKIFVEFFHKGWSQLIPFVVTIVAILLTDLLKGIAVGIVVGLYYVIRANYHAAISMTQIGDHYVLNLNKDVTFLNRARLRQYFNQIEENSTVLIDGSKTQFIDHDILETIHDFMLSAQDNNIKVEARELEGKGKIQPVPDDLKEVKALKEKGKVKALLEPETAGPLGGAGKIQAALDSKAAS
ncbi:SulP family inorganic anion transporter [Methylobacter sp. BBA5.1]|uniref:SulP family inorganic anion transporter n=1 Tax=Methylobacter sp. BBA5.1 TaxID=1495064 RepID=UPI00056B4D83|nr:SulP family inorganic anion transporter [Methylobacter sp. BBA5.1]